MRELVDHVGNRDRLHPRAGVRQQPGAEEDGELLVVERGERPHALGLGRRVRHGNGIYRPGSNEHLFAILEH